MIRIVVVPLQNIIALRGRTALRFVGMRIMWIMPFARMKMLIPISAGSTRLMRNALAMVIMTKPAKMPVRLLVLAVPNAELLAGLTCGSNPFSSYCGGGYNDVRETACRNGSTNTQCGGIISGICGGNPFDPLCGSGYTQNRQERLVRVTPFATRCAGDAYNDLRVSIL